MAKKSETGVTQQATATKAAVNESPDAKSTVMQMTACSVESASRLADKMTDEEVQCLVKAFTMRRDPRGVLQSIRDRIANDAIKRTTA